MQPAEPGTHGPGAPRNRRSFRTYRLGPAGFSGRVSGSPLFQVHLHRTDPRWRRGFSQRRSHLITTGKGGATRSARERQNRRRDRRDDLDDALFEVAERDGERIHGLVVHDPARAVSQLQVSLGPREPEPGALSVSAIILSGRDSTWSQTTSKNRLHCVRDWLVSSAKNAVTSGVKTRRPIAAAKARCCASSCRSTTCSSPLTIRRPGARAC